MKLGLFILKDIKGLIATFESLTRLLKKYENEVIGVEYLAFFHDTPDGCFGCLLCTKFKKGSLQSMIDHFKSWPHCESFLQKHFPNVFENIIRMQKEIKPSDDEYRHLIKLLVKDISKRCPEEHPIAINFSNALSCKIEITREIFEASKSKEKATNTLCIDLIQKVLKFGEKIKQERQKPAVFEDIHTIVSFNKAAVNIYDDISDGEIIEIEEMKSKIEAAKPKPIEFKSHRTINTSIRRRSQPREPSTVPIICEYKYQLQKASNKIESKYKDYRTTPDSHPDYNLEWKYYWKRKTIGNPNIDYTSSIFIETWKRFFITRLDELESEEILKTRIRIRKDLKLPIDPDDSLRLERILVRKIDDEMIEEQVRRHSPKRMRADINIDDIEESVYEKLTNRDRQSIIKRRPKFEFQNNTEDYYKIMNPDLDTPKIPKQSSDLNNNNKKFNRNNQEDDQSGHSSNEGNDILIMEDKEIKLLYANYDSLTDSTKSQLEAYMDALKETNPKKYEKLINENLQQQIEMFDVDDDDIDDEELMKNALRNAKSLPKASEHEYMNLYGTDTDFVDMSLSD